MTFRDLAIDVLVELGVYGPIDTPNAEDITVVERMGQRLIDNWNGVKEAIYAEDFLPFTITPSLQPHTIGPTGTWVTAQRPVSIEGASLLVTTEAVYDITVHRDASWYQSLVNPGYRTDFPTDLYYDPTWPNGSIYFWGIPTAAYEVQLLVRSVFTAYTLATTVSMPPGYRDAMTLTLKEMCAPTFAKTLTPSELLDASKARARIFSNNVVVPKLTSPAGLPGRDGGWYDYRSGQLLP